MKGGLPPGKRSGIQLAKQLNSQLKEEQKGAALLLLRKKAQAIFEDEVEE